MDYSVRNVPVLRPEGSIVASRCLKLSDDILFLLSSNCLITILDMGDITFLSKQTIVMLINLRERFEEAGGYLALANPRDVVKNLISLRRSQNGVDFFHTTLEAEAHIIEEFGDVDFLYLRDVVDFQLSLARHNKVYDNLSDPAAYETSDTVADEFYAGGDSPIVQVNEDSLEHRLPEPDEPASENGEPAKFFSEAPITDDSVHNSVGDHCEGEYSEMSDEEQSLMALSDLADREEAIAEAERPCSPGLNEVIDREIILENSLGVVDGGKSFSYEDAVSSVVSFGDPAVSLIEPNPSIVDPLLYRESTAPPMDLVVDESESPVPSVDLVVDESESPFPSVDQVVTETEPPFPSMDPAVPESESPVPPMEPVVPETESPAPSIDPIVTDSAPLIPAEDLIFADESVNSCGMKALSHNSEDPESYDDEEDAESLALGTYALLQEHSDTLQGISDAFQQGHLPVEQEQPTFSSNEKCQHDVVADFRSDDEPSSAGEKLSLLSMSDSELSNIVNAHKETKAPSFDFILEPDPLSDTGKIQHSLKAHKSLEKNRISSLMEKDSRVVWLESGIPFENDVRQEIGRLQGTEHPEVVEQPQVKEQPQEAPELLPQGGFSSKRKFADFQGPRDSVSPLPNVLSVDADDFETLCIKLKSKDPKKRWYAVRALGRLEDTRGISILEKLLKSEKDFSFIRDMAKLSLTRLNKLYNPMH